MIGDALPKIQVMTFYDVFRNASNMSPSLENNSSVSLKPKVSLKFNNDIDVDLHLSVVYAIKDTPTTCVRNLYKP